MLTKHTTRRAAANSSLGVTRPLHHRFRCLAPGAGLRMRGVFVPAWAATSVTGMTGLCAMTAICAVLMLGGCSSSAAHSWAQLRTPMPPSRSVLGGVSLGARSDEEPLRGSAAAQDAEDDLAPETPALY